MYICDAARLLYPTMIYTAEIIQIVPPSKVLIGPQLTARLYPTEFLDNSTSTDSP